MERRKAVVDEWLCDLTRSKYLHTVIFVIYVIFEKYCEISNCPLELIATNQLQLVYDSGQCFKQPQIVRNLPECLKWSYDHVRKLEFCEFQM